MITGLPLQWRWLEGGSSREQCGIIILLVHHDIKIGRALTHSLASLSEERGGAAMPRSTNLDDIGLHVKREFNFISCNGP